MVSGLLVKIGLLAMGVFLLGLCVFVHELGHFLAAKWRGLRIIAFSIGFRKIWGYTYKDVEYRIGWLPFGGYVELPQIDGTGEPKDPQGNTLPPVKPLDRMIVAFCGPFFNILFGVAVATVIWIHGIPQGTPKMRSFEVADVPADCPEYRAGLRPGDVIVKLNGKAFHTTWEEIFKKILFTIGEVDLEVDRGGARSTVRYLPAENPKILPTERIAYPFFTPRIPVVIYCEKGSPASKMGFMDLDEVVRVDGHKLKSQHDFDFLLMGSCGKPATVDLIRAGKPMSLTVTPEVMPGAKGGFWVGVEQSESSPIRINSVRSGSAAEAAGLRPNDLLMKVDGQPASLPDVLFNAVRSGKGEPVKLCIDRGGEELELVMTPRPFLECEIKGVMLYWLNHPNPWEQFVNVIDMSYKSLRGIFSRQSTLKARHLGGPIAIVKAFYVSVSKGSFIYGLNLTVMITFSLGLLNLLPLLVLDGGHILLAIIEMVSGRKLPAKFMEPVTMAFFFLLIGLMAFVTYNDIDRETGGYFTKVKDNISTAIKGSGEPSPAANGSKSLKPMEPAASASSIDSTISFGQKSGQ